MSNICVFNISFFYKILLLLLLSCEYVCGETHKSAGGRGAQQRMSHPLELEVKAVCCELTSLGAGMRTQVLGKNIVHS